MKKLWLILVIALAMLAFSGTSVMASSGDVTPATSSSDCC